MARKLSISVDHNLCVGNAMCETIATKAFVLNDDRQSEVADPRRRHRGKHHGGRGKLPG